MKFLLATLCFALTVTAAPISVSGSGNFSYDGHTGGTYVQFSGFDGLRSVGVSVETVTLGGFTLNGPYPWYGGAFINDGINSVGFISGSTKTVQFSLGDFGFVAIYEGSLQLAYVPIRGYVQLTSFNDPGCCGFYTRSGTFNIIPTPEPSTLVLSGGGLAALAFLRRTRRTKAPASNRPRLQ